MPDTVMESSRDVTIKLHNRIGKYVQVHLYFAARWVMLSEVTFTTSECTIFSFTHFFQCRLVDQATIIYTIRECIKVPMANQAQ